MTTRVIIEGATRTGKSRMAAELVNLFESGRLRGTVTVFDNGIKSHPLTGRRRSLDSRKHDYETPNYEIHMKTTQ